MRANIRDIIKAVKCDEKEANCIEDYINKFLGLNWSECSMRELKKAALLAQKEMSSEADVYQHLLSSCRSLRNDTIIVHNGDDEDEVLAAYERADAVPEIRELMEQENLTFSQLFDNLYKALH